MHPARIAGWYVILCLTLLLFVSYAWISSFTYFLHSSVLGHELGHLKCEHALYLTLGNLASSPLSRLPGLGRQIDSLLQDWRLAAEYTCDRAALLVAQDSDVVASSLMKLFAGTSRYPLNTKAFVEQSLEYEKQLESANPLIKLSIQQQQRTHPLPVKRVAELEKWFRSDEYQNLVPKAETETSSESQ